MRHPSPKPHAMARMAGAASLMALAACAGNQDPSRAPVEFRGSNPGSAAPAAGTPGIVAYDSYEAAVAREGETVAEIGSRVGISGAELGAYNGLQPGTALRAGDELVLPPRPGGYGGISVAAAAPSAAAPDGTLIAPAGDPSANGLAAAGAAGGVGSPVTGGGIETGSLAPTAGTAIGATAAAGAADGASTGAASGWTDASDGNAAWSPDLAAAAIDRAETPAPAPSPSVEPGAEAALADEVAAATPEPGPAPGSDIATPPSSGSPLPPEPQPTARPASPGLSQYQTAEPELAPDTRTAAVEEDAAAADREAAAALAGASPGASPDLGISFIRPVDGAVAVPYNLSNNGVRNEGVDFDAPPGSVVRAAAPGEVALVSQSLGGLGTIVLVRHRGDVLTVYGRVTNVQVGKGSRVDAGQPIGVVAEGDGAGPPRMHFEIRRGAESVNPEDYL
ncbi:MAG: LysM peptidoglycan-binding domain-containing M23 family metallopeptidase [Pseudomonadota bacterium]